VSRRVVRSFPDGSGSKDPDPAVPATIAMVATPTAFS